MPESESILSAALARRRAAQLYRQRETLASPQGVEVRLGDECLLSFCSNDYLGLANHSAVLAAFKAGADRYGVGSGASHLVSGHSVPHHALEEELAEFVGAPRALLFSTGYMANLGLMSALMDRHGVILEDKLNHASLIDAARLSQAQVRRYAHADARRVAGLVQNETRPQLIASDGVFSMDGDIAPIPELLSIARKHDAWLVIDDAHGLGVVGEHGRGSFEYHAARVAPPAILMGTLGKAFGTFGAFVAGSEEVVETLIQTARTYIYTTALPPAVAEATRASLRLVRNEAWRRERLQEWISLFRRRAIDLGFLLTASTTPIQPVLLGEAEEALAASRYLRDQGLFVPAIRPPTVPAHASRLRITFSSAHTHEHLERLLVAIEGLARSLGK